MTGKRVVTINKMHVLALQITYFFFIFFLSAVNFLCMFDFAHTETGILQMIVQLLGTMPVAAATVTENILD